MLFQYLWRYFYHIFLPVEFVDKKVECLYSINYYCSVYFAFYGFTLFNLLAVCTVVCIAILWVKPLWEVPLKKVLLQVT